MNKEEIKNLIKELIEKTLVKLEDITVTEEKGDSVWYSVQVSDPHIFIDRDGEALHALNHVVRRIIENKNFANLAPENNVLNQPLNVLIDINGFQKKKVDSVKAVAHMMGERARYFKANVEVDPMSAFERRVVHEFLADAADLKTESTGFGPTRRVIIKYTGGI